MEFMKRWMNTRVSQPFDVVVIGGGAAGLAAIAAALVFAVILPLYHQAVDVYSSIYLTINPRCRWI